MEGKSLCICQLHRSGAIRAVAAIGRAFSPPMQKLRHRQVFSAVSWKLSRCGCLTRIGALGSMPATEPSPGSLLCREWYAPIQQQQQALSGMRTKSDPAAMHAWR